jgi:myo-inositol-1(or 4)-monophosphatase
MKDQQDLEEYLRTAEHLAREAGELLMSRFGRRQQIEYKGAIDLVTDADRASEDLLVDRLKAAYPDHSIMTEEGNSLRTSSSLTWVIDPLDGTTNFTHGFPFFCVSIALASSGRPMVGAVYHPSLNEMFTVIRGGGARVNGTPLTVSGRPAMTESLLATGFPYDIREGKETNLEYFAAFAVRARAIRRAGAAALDLCYVAAGRFDGFWELKLHPWDIAAGSLMVEEAGGRTTDFSGGPYTIDTTHMVASNGLIHDEIIRTIAEVDSEGDGAGP